MAQVFQGEGQVGAWIGNVIEDGAGTHRVLRRFDPSGTDVTRF